MYVLASQLKALPIISLHTGQQVGRLGAPILNPTNLEILAFFVDGSHLSRQRAVLTIRDMRRLGPDGALVDSEDQIDDPADIVRLAVIVDQNFNLIGLPVVNELGQKLGKIEDFSLNLNTDMVQKIFVKQPIMRNLMLDKLVVDRLQIVEVTTKQVIVRDATVKKPLLGTAPVPPAMP